MKEIMYKNRTSAKNKRRVLFVSEKSENKSVFTHVYRIFIYAVGEEMESIPDLPAPTFFITKHRDSKAKEEKFLFRVKGLFYLIKGERYVMVNFCHSLRIDIVQKEKVSV